MLYPDLHVSWETFIIMFKSLTLWSYLIDLQKVLSVLIDCFFPDVSSDHLYSSEAYIYSKITPWALLADRAENQTFLVGKFQRWPTSEVSAAVSFQCSSSQRGKGRSAVGAGVGDPASLGGLSAGQAFRLEPWWSPGLSADLLQLTRIVMLLGKRGINITRGCPSYYRTLCLPPQHSSHVCLQEASTAPGCSTFVLWAAQGPDFIGLALVALSLPWPIPVLVTCTQLAQAVKRLPTMRETWVRSLGREDPLEKGMATTPVFSPGKSHGRRSLVSYSPWGRKELDTTERLRLILHSLQVFINLNPKEVSVPILFKGRFSALTHINSSQWACGVLSSSAPPELQAQPSDTPCEWRGLLKQFSSSVSLLGLLLTQSP